MFAFLLLRNFHQHFLTVFRLNLSKNNQSSVRTDYPINEPLSYLFTFKTVVIVVVVTVFVVTITVVVVWVVTVVVDWVVTVVVV